jgi:uncharacterized protein (DUF433 family)
MTPNNVQIIFGGHNLHHGYQCGNRPRRIPAGPPCSFSGFTRPSDAAWICKPFSVVLESAQREIPTILMDASTMQGQPCIEGTRIPVRAVLRAIEHYVPLDNVLKCYPHLTVQQVKDALFFAQTVLELPSGDQSTTTP